MKKITYSGTNKTVSFEYDAGNNLVAMTDWTGKTEYSYDCRNRLTSVKDPSGRTVAYEYDKAGRRTSLKYLEGTEEKYSLGYTYDSLNRLTQIADNLNAKVDFAYDAMGRKLSEQYANGLTTEFTYNSLNHLEKIKTLNSSQNVVMQLDFVNDKTGNVLQEKELNGVTKNYSYDEIYRLIEMSDSEGNLMAYTYDSAGNRLTETENGEVTSYTYNDANQMLTSTKAGAVTSFGYDMNGNLISTVNPSESTSYVYNFLNKIEQITRVNATGTETLTMAYNGEGKRISKTYGSGKNVQYIYDGVNILAEKGTEYGLNTAFYMAVDTDEIFARRINTQTEYMLRDRLGSLRKVTDAAGALLHSMDYKPFGLRKSGTSGTHHYLYSGREMDFEDLYFYRNRSYSPTRGVFEQMDPTGQFGGVNLYTYVNNNPMNYTDPLGLCPEQSRVEALMESLLDKVKELMKKANEAVDDETKRELIGAAVATLSAAAIIADIATVPSGEGLAATAGLRALGKRLISSMGIKEFSLQFGKSLNQISHTFRHIEKMGLDVKKVQKIIKNDFKKVFSEVIEGKPFNRVVKIDGKNIQYTAYKLKDGQFNIGRIHGID